MCVLKLPGTAAAFACWLWHRHATGATGPAMNNIIYIIGLIVVIVIVLSFLGLT